MLLRNKRVPQIKGRGVVPRNERDGAKRTRNDAKKQESAAEKSKGNCTIWNRKSAEISTQFEKIIGASIHDSQKKCRNYNSYLFIHDYCFVSWRISTRFLFCFLACLK